MHQAWQVQDKFVEINSRWLKIIGEHLRDEKGEVLEYWRIEKANSAIILPIQNQHFILPPPMYRPGVGEKTLDFPGGRLPVVEVAMTIVPKILERELGVPPEAIFKLKTLNTQGWAVNSSFSSQLLFGFVAELQPTLEIPKHLIGAMYPVTHDGIRTLLNSLTCLQCRTVLLEYWQQIFTEIDN